MPLPQKTVTHDIGAPAAGTKQWWSGTGNDLDATLTRTGRGPRGHDHAELPGPLEHRGLRDHAVRLRLRRGGRRHRLQGHPGNITKAAEKQRHRRLPGDLRAGDVRPVRLRGQDDPAAAALQDRRRRRRPEPGRRGGLLRRRDQGRQRHHHRVQRRCRERRQRLDGERLDRGRGHVRHSSTTTSTSPPTARTRPTTSTCRRVRTTSGSRPAGLVEHFPYQNGLLVSYWDTSQGDNNESEHPGQGLVLPIDANPRPIYRLDGKPWRGRIQTYDAPFGLEKSDSFTLHAGDGRRELHPRPGRRAHLRRPQGSTGTRRSRRSASKVPHVGVQIRVTQQSGTSMKVRISGTPGT